MLKSETGFAFDIKVNSAPIPLKLNVLFYANKFTFYDTSGGSICFG